MDAIFFKEHKKLVVIAAVVIVVLLLLFYGFKSVTENLVGTSSNSMSPSAPTRANYYGDVVSEDRGDADYKGINGGEVQADRSVIRTGDLSLIVERAEDSVRAITKITEREGGYVGNSEVWEVGGEDGIKNGRITIRIPASRFNTVWEEIKNLSIKVESESTNTRDVTEQLVDMDAQLRNLNATEEQFREVMKKASLIKDILEVQRELNTVRDKIERLEAQRINLMNQVDMSTISVYLTSEPDAEVFGVTWRPLYVAKQAARDALEDLKDFTETFTRLLIRLPVLIVKWVSYLILLFITFLILRKIYRFISKKYFSAPLPPEAGSN